MRVYLIFDPYPMDKFQLLVVNKYFIRFEHCYKDINFKESVSENLKKLDLDENIQLVKTVLDFYLKHEAIKSAPPGPIFNEMFLTWS